MLSTTPLRLKWKSAPDSVLSLVKSIFRPVKEMGDIYFDLEQTLRFRKEPLTLHEVNVLTAWRARVTRDFYIGFGGGSIVTYLGSQKLSRVLRLSLTVGAGAACALWRVGDSVRSSVRHVLSLEGSRIQRELATILLKKYHHNPWVIQHLSKHYYSEEVYDDSSVDRPTIRWRYRNFSGEYFNHSQSTSYGAHSSESHVNKTTLEPLKQVQVNAAGNALDNPFDLVFGLPENAENVPTPVEQLGSLSKKQRRKVKRSLRRHRRHHQHYQEESDD